MVASIFDNSARIVRNVAAATALLALAACGASSTKAPQKLSARADAGASVAATPEMDPTTTRYFSTAVGDMVYFGTDRTELTPEAAAVLRRQAEWLIANNRTARIEGHADERGTRDYNIALGARRANAVASFLVGEGVNPRALEVVSYGRERPLQSCSQERCWALNRRVRTAVANPVVN